MPKGRRSPRWAWVWDQVTKLGVVGIVVFGAYGIINANTTADSNAALARQAIQVSNHSIAVSNRHHAEVAAQNRKLNRKDGTIIRQGKALKNDTAALVAYHAQTTSILTQISNLEAEFDADVAKNTQLTAQAAAALEGGQNVLTAELASINANEAATTAALTAVCKAIPVAECPSS